MGLGNLFIAAAMPVLKLLICDWCWIISCHKADRYLGRGCQKSFEQYAMGSVSSIMKTLSGKLANGTTKQWSLGWDARDGFKVDEVLCWSRKEQQRGSSIDGFIVDEVHQLHPIERTQRTDKKG